MRVDIIGETGCAILTRIRNSDYWTLIFIGIGSLAVGIIILKLIRGRWVTVGKRVKVNSSGGTSTKEVTVGPMANSSSASGSGSGSGMGGAGGDGTHIWTAVPEDVNINTNRSFQVKKLLGKTIHIDQLKSIQNGSPDVYEVLGGEKLLEDDLFRRFKFQGEPLELQCVTPDSDSFGSFWYKSPEFVADDNMAKSVPSSPGLNVKVNSTQGSRGVRTRVDLETSVGSGDAMVDDSGFQEFHSAGWTSTENTPAIKKAKVVAGGAHEDRLNSHAVFKGDLIQMLTNSSSQGKTAIDGDPNPGPSTSGSRDLEEENECSHQQGSLLNDAFLNSISLPEDEEESNLMSTTKIGIDKDQNQGSSKAGTVASLDGENVFKVEGQEDSMSPVIEGTLPVRRNISFRSLASGCSEDEVEYVIPLKPSMTRRIVRFVFPCIPVGRVSSKRIQKEMKTFEVKYANTKLELLD